ncbi:hypothetical protein F2Q68_00019731 [Brassica cretica]|uniref:Uncharacterized protein n=2 Tax=Brassica cretica TaxID=69181 RepID=A0A8S9FWF5_BRACR|nr:hypothetical protein F2Q68_00019731 [Brassica cretica]KAF3566839.1 hypothetical protein DY000_02012793 [Brassica cretica]
MEMLKWEDLTLAIANIAWKSRNEVKIIETELVLFGFVVVTCAGLWSSQVCGSCGQLEHL